MRTHPEHLRASVHRPMTAGRPQGAPAAPVRPVPICAPPTRTHRQAAMLTAGERGRACSCRGPAVAPAAPDQAPCEGGLGRGPAPRPAGSQPPPSAAFPSSAFPRTKPVPARRCGSQRGRRCRTRPRPQCPRLSRGVSVPPTVAAGWLDGSEGPLDCSLSLPAS